MKRNIQVAVAASALVALVAACGATASPSPSQPVEPSVAPSAAPSAPASTEPAPSATLADIVDTATAAGSFSTLLQAATAAGLVDTLKGDGPFTVFAPTDEAFAALPAGTLEGLLADPEALKQILLYHVVSGAVSSEQVVGLTEAASVAGPAIAIKVADGAVLLNDSAKVVTPDVEASNGIIHVIDKVILPPSE